ncbi:class I SAM-dependent methyltransferase [Streptomyces afghaniensis]|uniref:class I SAM-dependent methyltransferase n=1 Tax=Streptomyces afghaniensis TaxID=66865 RepID=UPI00278206DD|nr:class I SAM-dependent methyltransferase [Streptomyces afghaniensis]MDQ1015672.1 SAM-dependent methyltransferase [Streptomyces afghaniensis]
MATTVSHHTGTRVTDGTEQIAADIERRLRAADRLVLPLEDTLELLRQLQQFDLGRFLLHNRGLNGYWTSYIFRNEPQGPVTPLEHWLLNNSLLCQARERFHRFKELVAECVADGVTLASVPCGVMDDLLEQDYRGVTGFRLVGVDLDEESLGHAAENARRHGLAEHTSLRREDAWNLGADGEFDLIVSNGLNMYESDPARLTDLYRSFHRALRPGGRLLLSFLTPPPPPPWEAPEHAAAWEKYRIGEADLRRELSIMGDIVQATYLNFSGEDDVRAQLEAAGFTVQAVRYNTAGVLPIATAVA